MPKARLRFAPSPTGYLHIGSLRTALFCYLAAKSLDGELILRIEDTDQKREVEGAVEDLIEILDWVGIKFNEGPDLKRAATNGAHANEIRMGGEYGPYIQSQRIGIYKKYADELIKSGKAYYCFCSQERLQKMREDQQAKKLPPRYDRCCRELTKPEIEKKLKNKEEFVIRQKMPLSGEVVVRDELRGEIKFKAEDMDDHVLIKSNHIPTYHFALVVDDHLMEITHVIRGEEWIPSFPKNILLYKDFGWQPPKFYHMPLTLNKEGGKLSKRQGDVAVEDYKKNGYLREALINFSVLLGWHPKDDQELFTLKELEKKFKLDDMGTSPAIFDIEKLDYINGYYIRQMDLEKLVELCRPYLKDNLTKTQKHKNTKTHFIKKVVALEQERLKKLSEIGELTEFFFVDKLEYPAELLIWKKLTSKEVKANLEKVYELLNKIPDENWTNDSIEDALITYIKAKEEKVGNYLWPMRACLTGRQASPGPFDVAEVLGKKISLNRIKEGINKL